MKPRVLALAWIAAASALLFCSTAAAAAGAAKPVVHSVTIDSIKFQPDAITVKVGDTVVWVNNDPFPHTVTSKAGGFDSHEIAAGKSWRYKAAKKGAFPYICTLHPTMTGTLRVQ